jgi:periplasmic protein TonB
MNSVAVRVPVAVLSALLITAGILFLMQLLIATGEKALSDSGTRYFLDFVRVKQDETIQQKDRQVEKPQSPEQAPPSAPTPRTDNAGDVSGISVNIAGPSTTNIDMDVGGTGWVVSDGEYLPIVKVAPEYPRRALTRGITGYVILEYTVTKLGTVRNPVVIEANPPGVFDDAAVKSALKYKYKPRVVDGEPIDVAGVRTIIRFELEN